MHEEGATVCLPANRFRFDGCLLPFGLPLETSDEVEYKKGLNDYTMYKAIALPFLGFGP